MLSYEDMIAEIAERIAEDDSHGYSQPNREGTGGIQTLCLSDGSLVSVHTGDYDCSELVRTCVAGAGLVDWDYWASYMWTGNEDAVLREAGFIRVDYDPDYLVRGDILWKTGHTGVYLGDYMMADAHGDEYGGIDGPNTGDQTGREIEIRSVWNCNWTRAYHYAGPARDGYIPPEQPSSDPQPSYSEEVETIYMAPTAVRFTDNYNIRDGVGLNSNVVGMYEKGESVVIDSITLKDGIFWGHYVGASSLADRYICVGHLDAVEII